MTSFILIVTVRWTPSIEAWCDSSCTVTFKIKDVIVVYKYNKIIRGCRKHNNKTWYFSLSSKKEYEKLGDNENIPVIIFYRENLSKDS